MQKRGDEIHVDETEASGGSKEGVVRYVLIISLFLAIAFLSIIWITGALTQDGDEEQINVSREMNAAERDSTIATEGMDEIEGAPTEAATDTGAASTVEN